MEAALYILEDTLIRVSSFRMEKFQKYESCLISICQKIRLEILNKLIGYPIQYVTNHG